MKKIDRTGEIAYNTFGSKMEIVRFGKTKDIDIYFEEYDCIVENKQYSDFKKGLIKCPYEKRVCKVGYSCGISDEIGNKCYYTWKCMLQRCYDEKFHIKNPNYKDCEVDPIFHSLYNFSEWYKENYYEVEGERMELDKDILVKGNKVYSPNTCIFLPQRINSLFVKCDSLRGDLPIGVCFDKRRNKYISICNKKFIGYYDVPIEAFNAYKIAKENEIKRVAEEYKDKIPKRLYLALINYEVEIDD